MAAYASNPASRLAPALRLAQCRYLIGDQQIIGGRVFDITETRVTPGARLHLLRDRKLLRVQNAFLVRPAGQRREVRLARPVTVFTTDACVAMRTVCNGLTVASQALFFEM
jgi:hypothetical protein